MIGCLLYLTADLHVVSVNLIISETRNKSGKGGKKGREASGSVLTYGLTLKSNKKGEKSLQCVYITKKNLLTLKTFSSFKKF